VCQKCSSKKFLLQSQSSKPLRVCDGCYNVLTATPNPGVESQIQGSKNPHDSDSGSGSDSDEDTEQQQEEAVDKEKPSFYNEDTGQ